MPASSTKGQGRGQIQPATESEAAEHLQSSGLLQSILSSEEPTPEQPEPAADGPQEGEPEAVSDPETPTAGAETEPEQTEAPQDPNVKVLSIAGTQYEVPLPLAEAYEKGALRLEDYTRKTQAVAEERKAVEAAKSEAKAERERLAQMLTQLEQVVEEITPTKEPDWLRIKAEDPEGFPAQFADWQIRRSQVEQIRAARQEAEAQVLRDREEATQRYIKEQEELLLAAIPDIKEPEKYQVFQKKLVAYARSQGFEPRDLAEVKDHRVILLLDKARRYDEALSKKPVVQPVKVMKPGGAESTTPPPTESSASRAAARLAKSGSDRDAADFLLASGILRPKPTG